MNSNSLTVILCASSIDPSSMPIGIHVSPAMVPVNGKPVISWILDDLQRKKIGKIVVVLRDQDQALIDFIHRIYSQRMDIVLARVPHGGSILHSLQAGLAAEPAAQEIRIILGDTLITDSYEQQDDVIYIGRVLDSRRWCVVQKNAQGHVIDYLDKQELPPGEHWAVAGYYHLQNGTRLRECVDQAISEKQRELANVLRAYSQDHPIGTVVAEDWYDFGHIDNLVDARKRLLRPRHFNTLSVNPILNTITKTSRNNTKLLAELDWYLQLPDELQVLTPRILRSDRTDDSVRIVQEYYGYPSLSELFVYGQMHGDVWRSILRQLLAIQHEFLRYPGEITAADARVMYDDKTWERLEQFAAQDPEWRAMIESEQLVFRGRTLRGIHVLRAELQKRIASLAQRTRGAITHGDYCFSNILYDVSNQIVRLIDPRGSFNRPGIYGDPRYDVAKLRHSTHGCYDYITADMFQLTCRDGAWMCGFICKPTLHKLPPRRMKSWRPRVMT
jgi:dTDP-glucose pyrophosphorylase